MCLKIIKSQFKSNSLRHKKRIAKSLLFKTNKLIKNLRLQYISRCGRSLSTGHITSWHRGSGKKKLFRNLNYKINYYALSLGVCYDPVRTGFLSLNFDLIRKTFFLSLAFAGCYCGSFLISSKEFAELYLGSRTVLKYVPPGFLLHNLSFNKDSKSKYIKSAGTFGQIIEKSTGYVKIKFPSNEIKKISLNFWGTIGSVSNRNSSLTILGNAGVARNLGRRPVVRGIAMNPVDHPHGGRTNGGRPSVTPWGLPTKSKFYLGKRKKNYE